MAEPNYWARFVLSSLIGGSIVAGANILADWLRARRSPKTKTAEALADQLQQKGMELYCSVSRLVDILREWGTLCLIAPGMAQNEAQDAARRSYRVALERTHRLVMTNTPVFGNKIVLPWEGFREGLEVFGICSRPDLPTADDADDKLPAYGDEYIDKLAGHLNGALNQGQHQFPTSQAIREARACGRAAVEDLLKAKADASKGS